MDGDECMRRENRWSWRGECYQCKELALMKEGEEEFGHITDEEEWAKDGLLAASRGHVTSDREGTRD